MQHALRIKSSSQHEDRGIGWSGGLVLGLLTSSQWVRNAILGCYGQCYVQQVKCSQQYFADGMSKAKQHQGRIIDATPTDFIQPAVDMFQRVKIREPGGTDLQNR